MKDYFSKERREEIQMSVNSMRMSAVSVELALRGIDFEKKKNILPNVK